MIQRFTPDRFFHLSHTPLTLTKSILAAVAVFAAAWSGAADATPTGNTSSNQAAYADSLKTLRSHSTASGQITYREILRSVYGEAFDIDSIIAAKTRWQQANADEFTFISDYGRIDIVTPLEVAAPIRNARLGSTVVGRYEPRLDRIKIADIANDPTVVHEAGHALQRAALLERRIHGTKDILNSELERSMQTGDRLNRAHSRNLARLRYLTAQDEFEIRLQDLNRFYAVVQARRPIATPIEALEALALIGLPIDPKSAEQALANTAWHLTADQLRPTLDRAYARSAELDAAETFEDAFEFVRLHGLIAETNPDLWDEALRKIAFEAPGHL